MVQLLEFRGGRDAAKIEADGAGAFAKAFGRGEIEHTDYDATIRAAEALISFTLAERFGNSVRALAFRALALIQSRTWLTGGKYKEEYAGRVRARIPRAN